MHVQSASWEIYELGLFEELGVFAIVKIAYPLIVFLKYRYRQMSSFFLKWTLEGCMLVSKRKGSSLSCRDTYRLSMRSSATTEAQDASYKRSIHGSSVIGKMHSTLFVGLARKCKGWHWDSMTSHVDCNGFWKAECQRLVSKGPFLIFTWTLTRWDMSNVCTFFGFGDSTREIKRRDLVIVITGRLIFIGWSLHYSHLTLKVVAMDHVAPKGVCSKYFAHTQYIEASRNIIVSAWCIIAIRCNSKSLWGLVAWCCSVEGEQNQTSSKKTLFFLLSTAEGSLFICFLLVSPFPEGAVALLFENINCPFG